MRMTRLHAPTLKEVPKDAEVVSHQLLVRGGYIRRLAAGIYTYLPLAQRVLRNIQQIVREEMDRAGAQEVLLPAVQPAEIWQESGRWGFYGPELLRLKDRKGADFCVGPTHEEVIVDLVRRDVSSYRALPLNLYQIQTKFRDEIRPRAGLMRGREFIMKDAYSFDVDEAGANASYDAMFEAYQRIFSRCGLEFRPVEADTGAIGGSRSHEFQVLADSGEDAIVGCTGCAYAANVEQAELSAPAAGEAGPTSAGREAVPTPNTRTIEEVVAFLGVPTERVIKTLLFEGDGKAYAALVRGDHHVNEIKLKKLLGVAELTLVAGGGHEDSTAEPPVQSAHKLPPFGFAGPVDIAQFDVAEVIADHAVRGMRDAVCGGNQADVHWTHVDEGHDFTVGRFADLREAVEGDPCARCSSPLKAYRGIEVGHVFFLGTKYSDAMKCNYLDENGREQPMVMGCYGIGVSRIMSAAVEQNHDDYGVIWPRSMAPYQVTVLPLQMNREDVVAAAEKIYAQLLEQGVEVLIDDRAERAGAKFKDADLLGVPVRIAIGGRGLNEGVVELKLRSGSEIEKVPLEQLMERVAELLG